ncbi:MAG: (2Fe-2S)-binding protein [Bacteroidetes bacterium]|nr:(2Fe-2S)-binding protein [Bacteroidota bacterium]MBU1423323.1 (2Fe-2S)-binding protein [Bacteroidota bacterium]MBU2636270.1 (2Fe-2S)-binding protein [Bacteroidota bacterium]
MKTIELNINGKKYSRTVPFHRTLLEFLHDDLAILSVKEGCGEGECGACTVMLDNKPVNSCLILAVEADGTSIRTVEGEVKDGKLSPLQESFKKNHATQCGFCTPGMIMSAQSLLERNPKPNEEEIKEAIEGNFCRCTGYRQIIDAIFEVTKNAK